MREEYRLPHEDPEDDDVPNTYSDPDLGEEDDDEDEWDDEEEDEWDEDGGILDDEDDEWDEDDDF